MPQEEKHFTARLVDTQFEQLAQAIPAPFATPNSQVVNSLQTLYGDQLQQEQQSLERMRLRLSLAVAAKQEEALARTTEANEVVNDVPRRLVAVPLARSRRPWLRGLEQCVAVLLVFVIIASWFALSHLPHSSSGSAQVFSDANARSLGAPISTIKGNFSSVEAWSPDSHTLALLQVDTQKHRLVVQLVDVASKHSRSYPVLDSSWIPALEAYSPFRILMGRYLLAARAEGKNQATLEIWDITGQRPVSTQTVPAVITQNGQVDFPRIVPSNNEQKLAILAPDEKITIWDVASGQKLFTFDGKITDGGRLFLPIITWYNHDQSLLFSRTDSNEIVAWNTVTGEGLFTIVETDRIFSTPLVSPNNKYLAVSAGARPSASTAFRSETLTILDAHSGKILHQYNLNASSNMSVTAIWQPDSQHMVVAYMPNKSSVTTPLPQTQFFIWNVFTGQKTFLASLSSANGRGSTPDGTYLIAGNSDGRSLEIWQTNSGHKVATVTTPGIYARTDSFFYTNNQQMLIGQKGNFDIWDITNGKLLYKYHGSTPFSIDGVNGSLVFWSPDGKYLTMMAGKSPAVGDGVVSIWRLPGA